MINRKVVVDPLKQSETIVFYTRFGYVLRDAEDQNGKVVMHFIRDEGKESATLASLERDYHKVQRNIPLFEIIWAAVGIVLIALYIILKGKFMLDWLILGFGILITGFSIYLFVAFFTLFFGRKKIVNSIFRSADKITGFLKEFPTNRNIDRGGEQAGLIKSSIPQILNK